VTGISNYFGKSPRFLKESFFRTFESFLEFVGVSVFSKFPASPKNQHVALYKCKVHENSITFKLLLKTCLSSKQILLTPTKKLSKLFQNK
jgi:hypothetical protein